jgi:hypothetical protein
MTSYDTPYNRQLGRAQRLYDYADIDQDREDIEGAGALNGGSLPADIADEIPENKIVGGQRRGAEMSDILHPSGQISKVAGRGQPSGGMSHLKKKTLKGKGEGLVSGGDFFNDLIGTVGNVAQTAGHLLPLFGLGQPSGGAKTKRKLTKGQMEKLLKAIAMRDAKRGKGQGAISGGDQIMDTDDAQLLQPTFTNMGHSGRHNLNTNAIMGNGMSGGIDFGRLFNQGKHLANQGLSLARQGCSVLGNGQPSGGNAQGRPYDFYEGMGEERPVGGMYNKMAYNGSGVISDLGIPGISQIAGLFGLGQPSGGQSPDEDEIMKSFLGGRKPSEVPKEEKNMLMRKALADAQLASEVKMAMERAMTGRGLSGGELPMMERMVGGDFFNDLIGTVGNVAQTAGHLLPLFGLGQPSGGSGYGNLRHRLKGGAIEDGMPFNSPPPSMYYSNTPITGSGMSGGAGYDMADLQKAVMLNQAMSQAPMMASGQPSGGQMVGGRRHMEGGDFFNDLIGTVGNVAQTAGHLLPLFGLGQPSGGMMDTPMSSSELQQNAVSGGRMRKGRHLLLKPQMRGSSLSGMGQPSGGDQADLDYQPMKAEYETQGSYGDPDERGDTKGKGQPSGGKKPRGSSSRNAIVAKVMREKGMKLVEASKYVKAHNLYKK